MALASDLSEFDASYQPKLAVKPCKLRQGTQSANNTILSHLSPFSDALKDLREDCSASGMQVSISRSRYCGLPSKVSRVFRSANIGVHDSICCRTWLSKLSETCFRPGILRAKGNMRPSGSACPCSTSNSSPSVLSCCGEQGGAWMKGQTWD